jgi:hypothetical protein
VLGHHDIAANHKEITAANPLQRVFKEITWPRPRTGKADDGNN